MNKPKMTLERFEHELVKLKSQFPANHVGVRGSLQDRNGNCCILGQVMVNLGVPQVFHPFRGYMTVSWASAKDHMDWNPEPGGKFADVIGQAILMNNQGTPWHQIVDALVPPTRGVEAPASEPIAAPELVTV